MGAFKKARTLLILYLFLGTLHFLIYIIMYGWNVEPPVHFVLNMTWYACIMASKILVLVGTLALLYVCELLFTKTKLKILVGK